MFTSSARSLAVLVLASIAMLAAVESAGAATPKVVSGSRHSCVLADSGAISCWGNNLRGQLGDGTTEPRTSAVPAVLAPKAIDVAVGDLSTCALAVDGTVWCWGDNSFGVLGNGTFDSANHPVPTQVAGLSGVRQLSGGFANYCALLTDNTARCWGTNSYGEIGNAAATNPQTTPIAVTGLTSIAKIAAGYAHSCAVLTDGTGRCWGYNTNGMLGNGTTGPGGPSVVTVLGLAGATDISASGYYSCALASGGAQCWGGASTIGTANGTGSSVAIAPPGLIGATALGGSNGNGCAVVPTNSLKCWGFQVGNGTATTVNAPVEIPALSGAFALSQNGYGSHVCAILRGGAVKCWGDNTYGQTGSGAATIAPVLTPAVVVGADAVTKQYSAAPVLLRRASRTSLDKKKKTYTVPSALIAGLPELLSAAESCTGTVTVTVKYSYRTYKRVKGKRKSVRVKKTAKTTGPVTSDASGCIANSSIKLPVKYLNGKKVALNASWPGNATLAPIATSTEKFKLPTVKAKKKKKKK